MKTLFTLAFLMLSLCLFSQEKKNRTTVEEYNYLVNGYEKDIESGNSIKSGYELKLLHEFKSKTFKIKYFNFYNTKEEESKAVFIIIEKNNTKKIKYLCLPFNNIELLEKFYKKTEKLGLSMQMEFDVTIYGFLSKLFNYRLNEADTDY